jgi:hypothetical protein
MPTHVVAIFAHRHAVHAAIEQLVQAGFTRDAISLLMSESMHESQFGGESSERSGVRTIPATGVLGAMASAMVKFPAPTADFVLCGSGPLAAGTRRVMDGKGVCVLEAALEAAGLAEDEANFIGRGLRYGSLALGVIVPHDRARLATQLLELSGGESLRAA